MKFVEIEIDKLSHEVEMQDDHIRNTVRDVTREYLKNTKNDGDNSTSNIR